MRQGGNADPDIIGQTYINESPRRVPSRPSTSTDSHSQLAHFDGQVDVSVTPSRANGHGVSVVVTPRIQCSVDGHLSDPEPLSGWEGSSPVTRRTS